MTAAEQAPATTGQATTTSTTVPAAPEQATTTTVTVVDTFTTTTTAAPEGMPNTGGPPVGPAGLVLVALGGLLWRASRRRHPPGAEPAGHS